MKRIIPAALAVTMLGSTAFADAQFLSDTGQLSFGVPAPAQLQQKDNPAVWKAKPSRQVSQRQRTVRSVSGINARAKDRTYHQRALDAKDIYQ